VHTTVRLRTTPSVDECQFLTCLKHDLWAARKRRFGNWQVGDLLAFIVDRRLAGLGEVSGKPFESEEPVFEDHTYPYRIPIRFEHVTRQENRCEIPESIREAPVWKSRMAFEFAIAQQHPMPDDCAEIIAQTVRSRPNDLEYFQDNLPRLLEDAKRQRAPHRGAATAD